MPHGPMWRRYLRFVRPDPAADVDDELRFHFDSRVTELVALGTAPGEARRQAEAEFGDVEAWRGRLREIDARMERRRERRASWHAGLRDARYVARGLVATPRFTWGVVLALAVSIGAVTAMYGIARRLLLEPPPHVVAPDSVRHPYFVFHRRGGETYTGPSFTFDFFERVRDGARSVASIGAYLSDVETTVGTGADAAVVHATLVSDGYWRTLGVRPALGRFFADAEAHPATGARVVVLGDAFWRRRFAAARDVVGRTLRVDGLPYEIVGVAPRGFRGIELGTTDVWLPLYAYGDGGRNRQWWEGSVNLSYALRLRDPRRPEVAAGELETIRMAVVEASNQRFLTHGGTARPVTRQPVLLRPITAAIGTDAQPIPEAAVARWLVAVAGILLAVACANVTGLLAMRLLRRRREIGVRLALGMSRARLTALLLTESLLLAALGGAGAAVLVALGGAYLRRTLLPEMSLETPGVDWTMFSTIAAIVLGVALLVGLAPVVQSRALRGTDLNDGGQRGTSRRPRAQTALLVAQTALSVVLLVGAGLFVRSLARIASIDLGLDVRNTWVVHLDFTGSGRSRRDVTAFHARILERLRAIPGARAASFAEGAPLHGAIGASIRLPGASDWFRAEQGSQMVNVVSEDFFASTGMRMLEGRPILASDRTGPAVVVVSAALARAAWPGRSPVGSCVYTSFAREVCATIVGVVDDARSFATLEEDHPGLWFFKPLAPDDMDEGVFLVRGAPGVRHLDATIRRAVAAFDPSAPYADVRVLGAVLDPQMRPWRLGAALFTAFGALAALLAALGLYTAVGYAAALRTREMGVRLTLGALPLRILGLVFVDGCRVALLGITLGLVLAALGGRWIGPLLFHTSPHDPLVLVAVGATLAVTALLATLAPARRAARVDPVIALRAE